MVKMQICVSVAVVGFFSMFSMGDAIQCWICSSSRDPDCNDPFQTQNYPLMDCSLRHTNTPFPPNSCMKTIEYDANGLRHVVRSCAWQNQDTERGKCKHQDSLAHSHITVEYCGLCDQNGCNGAPSDVLINRVLQIGTVAVALFAAKLTLF